MQIPPAWHIPRFQTPRRKAGAQHKLHGLHREARYSELLVLFRVVGTLLKSKFPDANEGPTLQGGVSKDKQSRACCVNSLLHIRNKQQQKRSIWKFPGQGLNPSHSCATAAPAEAMPDPSTHHVQLGIKAMPLQQPEPLRWDS